MVDMRDAPVSMGDKILYISSDGGRMWGEVVGFTLKMVRINVGYSRNHPPAYLKVVDSNNILVL